MRHSDCLPPVSPRFVAFAWRYRRAPAFFRFRPRVERRGWTWALVSGPPTANFERRRQALPGSRGTSCVHALGVDPDETIAPTVATA
jgi:hypothetical protein